MLFWLGLVAGLIIGWVVEWVIDWSFWRRDAYASLEDESRLRAELDAARAEISKLEAIVATPSREPVKEPGKESAATITPDQLQNIHGIGNVFAKRLNEAGIFTFGQLGALSVDEVAQIIKPQEWQSLNFDSWITQARSLSTKVNTTKVNKGG